MMLLLERFVAAVESIAISLNASGNGTPQTAGPPKARTKKDAPPPVETGPATKEAPAPATKEALSTALKELVLKDKGDKARALAILNDYGDGLSVPKVAELPQEALEKAYARVMEALNG